MYMMDKIVVSSIPSGLALSAADARARAWEPRKWPCSLCLPRAHAEKDPATTGSTIITLATTAGMIAPCLTKRLSRAESHC